MTLVEINWNPSKTQLRQFGVICFPALPLVGWLWNASLPIIGVLAVVGFLLGCLGFIFPPAIKPVFLALTIVATPIGLVVGEMAMLLIYFGVFFPIGILMRFTGKDALQKKLDRNAATYWNSKRQPNDVASYYRQS